MITSMRNFFINSFRIIILFICSASVIASTSSDQLLEDVIKIKSSILPQQLILDFSTAGIKVAPLQIGKYLAKYNVPNNLTVISSELGIGNDQTMSSVASDHTIDMIYLAVESISAFFRANSTEYPKLAALFSNGTQVYNSFVETIPQISGETFSVGDLGDLQKCQAFVSFVMDKNLPTLIDLLVAQTLSQTPTMALAVGAYKSEITTDIKGILAPTIAQLLNSSYLSLFAVTQAVEGDLTTVEEVVAKNNYKYLTYAALAAGTVGLIVAMLRYVAPASSNSSKK